MNILLLSIILTVIKLSFKATKNLIEQLSLDLFSFFLKKKSDSHLYNPGNKKMTLILHSTETYTQCSFSIKITK